MQAKRAQEAKAAAEELLSAANDAAANSSALERTRLTSSDVPLSPPQARHNSLAEGSQHLSALSALSSPSVEDAPGGKVTGLELSTVPGTGSPGAASPSKASPDKAASTARLELNSDSREFLIRLERELVATGTNFNPDGSCKSPGPQQSLDSDPLRSFDAANASAAGAAQQRVSRDAGSAELMKLLHIDESELSKPSGKLRLACAKNANLQ